MILPRPTFRLMLCVLLAVCTAAAAAAVMAPDDARRDDPPTTKRAVKTHTVKVKGMKYAPGSLKIREGETVVWKNEDDHDHTVIADDKSFKSGNMSADDSFEYTFKKAGKFKYGCKYHPRERGTIAIEK